MVVKVMKARAETNPKGKSKSVKKRRIARRPDLRPVAILTGEEWRENITPKQAMFVEQYLIDLSPSKAAIRAGYAQKNASSIAAQLLNNISVANAIDAALAKGASVTRPRIIQELARIAFANAGDYFEWDDNGIRVKDSKDLSDDQMAVICEVRQNVTKEGKNLVIRMSDKMAALDKLARITRLLKTESLEVTGANGAPLIPEGATTRDVAEAVLGVLNATKPRPAAYMGDLVAIEDKHAAKE